MTHLVAGFMLAENISHGLVLRKVGTILYFSQLTCCHSFFLHFCILLLIPGKVKFNGSSNCHFEIFSV